MGIKDRVVSGKRTRAMLDDPDAKPSFGQIKEIASVVGEGIDALVHDAAKIGLGRMTIGELKWKLGGKIMQYITHRRANMSPLQALDMVLSGEACIVDCNSIGAISLLHSGAGWSYSCMAFEGHPTPDTVQLPFHLNVALLP